MPKRKKQLLIIAALFVGLLLVVVIVSISSKSNNASNTNPQESTDGYPTITVQSDPLLTAGMTVLDVSNVTNAIESKLNSASKNLSGDYSAVIRNSSVTVSTVTVSDTDTVPYYDFMTDIPSIKRSFHITLTGGANEVVSIMHVNCPIAAESIYPAFSCKDGEQ